MKWIKYLVYLLISLYIAFCIGLYFGQEKVLFFPDPLSDSYTPSMGTEVWIPVDDGIRLHAVHAQSPNPSGVVLYLHGNRGNVRRCLHQTRQLQNQGYDIFVPDYRSFGKSEGRLLNESQMYHDAQSIFDYLKDRYDNIAIVGYSMGTGPATYLAAHNEVVSLLLVAPYVSLLDMKNRYLPFVPDFLLKYHFRTDLNLNKVTCPIAIVHGQQDEVIPYDSSEALVSLFPHIRLTGLSNVGHRRVIFDAAIGQSFRYVPSNH